MIASRTASDRVILLVLGKSAARGSHPGSFLGQRTRRLLGTSQQYTARGQYKRPIVRSVRTQGLGGSFEEGVHHGWSLMSRSALLQDRPRSAVSGEDDEVERQIDASCLLLMCRDRLG